MRVLSASNESIGLELLWCMPPLLGIVVEHVFRVFDVNAETLQSSVDICVSGVGVVGLDSFELLKKFFEVRTTAKQNRS